jgi:integrase
MSPNRSGDARRGTAVKEASWDSSSRPSSVGAVDARTGQRSKRVARDSKWKARYRDPNGRARRKTFDRKIDAERFLERAGADIQRGDWIDPRQRRVKFEDIATQWFATTGKLAPSTRRGYEKNLRIHVRPYFQGWPVANIDWLDVETFISDLLDRGLSPKTVRECLSVLSLVMKTAVRAKVLREHPAASHSIPRRRPRSQPLTMEQINLLVDHADERYRAAVWLLALAGLRVSELCGLRVADVDWQRHTITVSEAQMWVNGTLVTKGPKTDSGVRVIPIPAWLADDLAAMLAARHKRTEANPDRAERLFRSPTGKPMVDHTVWRIVHRAQVAAGLPRFRPYDLRHSHASLLIDLGAHPKAISERMGHAEIGVTMNVYGHLFSNAQERLTADLDELRARTRPTPASEPIKVNFGDAEKGAKRARGRAKGAQYRSPEAPVGPSRTDRKLVSSRSNTR